MSSNDAVGASGRASRSSGAKIGVTSSPDIAFPAPAPPLPASTSSSSRSRRGAAQAAAANILRSSASKAVDRDGSPTSSSVEGEDAEEDGEGAPSLTNGDSDYDDASSMIIDGRMGETDEYTMDEMEYSNTARYKDELTDEDELLAPQTTSKRKASTSSPPKSKRSTKAAKVQVKDEEEDNGTTAIDYALPAEDTKPKRKAKSKAARAVKEATEAILAENEHENGNGKANDSDGSDLTDLDGEAKAAAKPKKARKPRKPRAPKPEPVYVIPEVEKLPNTQGFQGRLGYACLNTILRKRKPPVFCSRTCRIDTIKKNGMDFLKELGRTNITDLATLIQWNEDNNIRFMRLSSEMFPFASHGEYGYDLEYADKELKAAGDLANKYGHRVTTHPGQFTQLGSPRKVVVDNAIADLTYHCEMLDRMGIGKEGVMIIHGGGVFGDKPGTIERLKKNYIERVPENVKARLVLENDEMGYNVDDLLPICEELNIPLVLDYHHHNLFPTAEKTLEELMPRILATWDRKGIKPKFHLSEPRLGAVSLMERRAHSDRCKLLPTPLPPNVDLMIEAKDKEQAVFQLHRIYDLQPTIHENLRPPVEVESLRTQGRKSSKKKKVKTEDAAEEEEGEEGATIEGEDPDEAMIDMDGAEVLPPPEPVNTIASTKSKTTKKTPAKPKNAKVPQTPGEGDNADTEATPAPPKQKKKAPAPRKVKNIENEEGMPMQVDANANEAVIEQVLAEPAEAQPVEDMKAGELPNVGAAEGAADNGNEA